MRQNDATVSTPKFLMDHVKSVNMNVLCRLLHLFQMSFFKQPGTKLKTLQSAKLTVAEASKFQVLPQD